jgi:small subunit ribosomal protein S1
MKTEKLTMEELLLQNEESFKTLEKGDTVEGRVVSASKNGIWLDLGKYGSGLVVGPEINDKSIVGQEVKSGDTLSVTVTEPEIEEGYAILSLKKVSRENAWSRLIKLMEEKAVISVKPFDANKGGLLIEVDGVRGFLPVSQLSTDKYPRVSDKDEIQSRLNELTSSFLNVIVLDIDERENKLIFSEKAAHKTEINEVLDKFAIGDIVEGRVTGVVNFGVFVNVNGVEGLVHISEISWNRVEDPSKIIKVGDEVKTKIIGIENDRFSLSMKRLTDDPWAQAAESFKVGDIIEGEVTRVTPFGAFVRIHERIEALVHISELAEGHIANPNEVVEVAKKYKFLILSIDKENHKIALSLKAVKLKEKDVKEIPKEIVKKEKITKTSKKTKKAEETEEIKEMA